MCIRDRKVITTLETKESHYEALYPDEMSLKDKIKTVATEIYGACLLYTSRCV